MQENWQVSLKQHLTDLYVRKSPEWVDVNISTSGLLNLTIVSDRFVGLSMPDRKKQISTLLQSQLPNLSPGFLSLYTLQEVEPNISIAEIFGEVRIPNATGRLFVVPAGYLNLDYVSKVDDLHAPTVIDRDDSLWSVFKREIYELLNPDIILIDSRNGISQWGALSLIQAADEAIIFLFPNEQNQQGTELIVRSL